MKQREGGRERIGRDFRVTKAEQNKEKPVCPVLDREELFWVEVKCVKCALNIMKVLNCEAKKILAWDSL